VAQRLFHYFDGEQGMDAQVILIQATRGKISMTSGKNTWQWDYHYYVRVGNTVLDSITTAPGNRVGMSFGEWSKMISGQFSTTDVTGRFRAGTQAGLPGY